MELAQHLTPPTQGRLPYQEHGACVAVEGDTAVIGSPGAMGSNKPGQAEVYERGANGWELTATLQPTSILGSSPGAIAFGSSVAISGDVIAVGARASIVGTGVYIYQKRASQWVLATSIGSRGTSVRLGEAVALSNAGRTLYVGMPGVNQVSVYSLIPGTINSALSKATLTSTAGSDFGASLSVDQDTLVVGAPLASGGGAALVYLNPGIGSPPSTPWPLQATLKATGSPSVAGFGKSVSISGDRVLVGSQPTFSTPASARLFKRTGTTWQQQAVLNANVAFGNVGTAARVFLAGDVAAVGAESNNAARGEVSLYQRQASDDSWSLVQTLVGDANEGRGSAVALTADKLIVGGRQADTQRGMATAYAPTGGQWQVDGQLAQVATDLSGTSFFGQSLAMQGPIVAVGAPKAYAGGPEKINGCVYVFERNGLRSWKVLARLTAHDLTASTNNMAFGQSVALSVGAGRLLVGAMGAVGSQPGHGAIYVYRRQGADFVFENKLLPPRAADNAVDFGYALAADDDSAVIGAPALSTRGKAGMAFRVDGISSRTPVWTLLPPSKSTVEDGYGSSVAIDGSTVAVGAGLAGRAFVFTPTVSGPKQQLAVLRPLPPAFMPGLSVALLGDRLAVGAPAFAKDGQDASAVLLYQRASGRWSLKQTLTASTSRLLGTAVALDGDLVLGGAASTISPTESSALLFKQEGNQWPLITTVRPTQSHGISLFGAATALTSDLAAVAEPIKGDNPGVALYLRMPQMQVEYLGSKTVEVHPWSTQLNFGNQVVGRAYRMSLVLSNTGIAPLGGPLPTAGIGFTLSGKNADDFRVVNAGPHFVAAGQRLVIEVEVLPQMSGLRQATLTLATNDPANATLAVPLQAIAEAEESAPVIYEAPSPVLDQEGSPGGLGAGVTGTEPLVFEWRKDGKLLPGQSRATLSLGELTRLDAGLYTVKATNAQGSAISNAIPVTVVSRDVGVVTVFEQRAFTLRATVWGSHASAEWQLPQSFLDSTTLRASGVNTKQLTVTNTDADATGEYRLHVTTDKTDRQFAMAYVDVLMKPRLRPEPMASWQVGVPVATAPYALADYFGAAERWQISGLPPGVVEADFGALTGNPTAPGRYRIRVVASNAAGSSEPLMCEVEVLPLPEVFQGRYQGLVYRSIGHTETKGALASLVVAPNGLCTFSTQSGKARRAVVGRLIQGQSQDGSPTWVMLANFAGRPRQNVELFFGSPDSLDPQIASSGYLVYEDSVDFGEVLVFKTPWSSVVPASAWAGRYTATLTPAQSTDLSDPAVPLGYGYGVLDVAPSGQTTWAGRLASGSVATCAGPLTVEALLNYYDVTPVPMVPLFLPHDQGTGSALGFVQVVQTDPSFSAYNLLQGSLEEYRQPGAAVRGVPYSTGITQHGLIVAGERYFPPVNGHLVLGLENVANNASLRFSGAGIESVGMAAQVDRIFRVTDKHLAIFAPDTGDPTGLTFKINPETGVFQGSFTLTDFTPGQVLRKVSYHGVLRPFQGQGYGAFLLPSLPAPATEPAVLSGKVFFSATKR